MKGGGGRGVAGRGENETCINSLRIPIITGPWITTWTIN